MAIKMNVKTVHGIDVVDAYLRVECVQLAGKKKIAFQLRSYADTCLPFFSDVSHEADYDIDGANPIA